MARNQSRLVLVFLLCVALHPLWRQCGPQHVPFRRQAFIGTRAAGGGVPAKRSSIAKLAAAASDQTKQSPESIWVRVKGGEPVEYTTENLRNVGDLLKAVKTEENLSVGTGRLKLYASKEAYDKKDKALDPMDKVPEQGCNDDGKPIPFYVHYPLIGGAGVPEASLSEAQLKDMRAAVLKAICKQQKIKDGGRKSDLVERLLHAYSSPAAMEEERLKKKTRPGLERICRERGLKVSGSKTELVQRILAAPPIQEAPVSSKNSSVFFLDPGALLEDSQNYAPPDKLWAAVKEHVLVHQRMYIRGAPRTGKTAVLKWAEKQQDEQMGKVLLCRVFSEDRLRQFLLEHEHFKDSQGGPSVERLSNWNGTVLFDEAQKGFGQAYEDQHREPGSPERYPLVAAVLHLLLKRTSVCRSIFAGIGQANAEGGSLTPAELKDHAFLMLRPAPLSDTRPWLISRLRKLFVDKAEAKQTAGLMLELCGVHLGLLSYVGFKMEERLKTPSPNLRARQILAILIEDPFKSTFSTCRVLGLDNGSPETKEDINGKSTTLTSQAALLSMIRCCGTSTYRDKYDKDGSAWTGSANQRAGLSRGLYAPLPENEKDIDRYEAVLQKIGKDGTMGPTCALQPEMMHFAFTKESERKSKWHSLDERWVTEAPTCATDLALSFLSHMRAGALLSVTSAEKVEVSENSMQEEFEVFCKEAMDFYVWAAGTQQRKEQQQKHPPREGQMQVQPEFRVNRTGDGGGRLDFAIGPQLAEEAVPKLHFGLELMIRGRNTLESPVFESSTKKSLRKHVSRADATAAQRARTSSYEQTVLAAEKGYVTLLIATSTTHDHTREFEDFKAACREMWQDMKLALQNHERVLFALCPMGWSTWDVFSFNPANATDDNVDAAFERFEIKRQRLMYKIVNGMAVSARHFYPRPTEVWAKQLVAEGDELELTGRAFKVKPEDDDVASLAEGIASKLREEGVKCGGRQLTIYQNSSRTGEWQKLEKRSQVLYENTEDRPYGFVVPRSAA